MIKIVICDDDVTYTDKIYRYLVNNFKHAEIETYHDGSMLLQNSEKQYDVAFLDIEMPGFSGFELARQLIMQNEDMSLVFISNYEEKVYESFRFRPLRFIRKSKLDEEIDETLEAIRQDYNRKHMYMKFFDTNKVVRQANVNDIMFFESNRHYVNVVTTTETFVIREKMTDLEKRFEQFGFLRIQIGYIVNMKFIRSINGYSLMLDNGMGLSIGRNNLSKVKDTYMDYVRTIYNR